MLVFKKTKNRDSDDMDLDDYYTTKEAAKVLKLSTSRIRQLSKRLKGVKKGIDLLFLKTDIYEFAKLDRPWGNRSGLPRTGRKR